MQHIVQESEEELIRQLYNNGKTQQEIADELGCAKSTVSRKMDEYEIETGYNGSIHPGFFWSQGYLCAQARTSGGRRTFYVHRLTAFAHFDGSMEEFYNKQVHHRDKTKFHNSERNLEPLDGKQHRAVHCLNEWVEEDGWPVLLSPRYAEGD